jgi:hypothetical protein
MLEAALMGEIPRETTRSFDDLVHQREAQVLRTAYRILGNSPLQTTRRQEDGSTA